MPKYRIPKDPVFLWYTLSSGCCYGNCAASSKPT